MAVNWKRLHELALAEVQATLAALPKPLQAEAVKLPITFERRPNRAMQADGIEPDTLGLFVGPEYAEQHATNYPLPPRIILYLENVWNAAEADEDAFRREIRATLLHELGHYLGLDEDGLAMRGLE